MRPLRSVHRSEIFPLIWHSFLTILGAFLYLFVGISAYHSKFMTLFIFSIFIFSLAQYLTSYSTLVSIDPGFTKESNIDTEEQDICDKCKLAKPERTRHCSKCGRCVDLFDHHCPYVFNCVGKNSFPYFFKFLVFSSLSALISVIHTPISFVRNELYAKL